MEYSDGQILESAFMLTRLRRASCPLCGTITVKPLGSQVEFSHRFFPAQTHGCAGRILRFQGVPEWTSR